MTSPTELSLAVDRVIDASPETVYRLLTEPALYAEWFGPEGAEVSVEELDLRLGDWDWRSRSPPWIWSSASRGSTRSSSHPRDWSTPGDRWTKNW